ncbi:MULTISPECIES: hypothetical protein [unclassified Streptomyces]|uniref:hypothetical protein n=1 Tax=unclassified Streptomyces TaxID=2593676 RepID=UPI00131B7D39|nr:MULTISPECIES: hypothetical protein [unclassified Streptomyces]MYX20417.1 hypothetical protein [Streptomyces sp. SID8380]
MTSSAAEMTPAAFKTAREALSLSDGWLGDHLGVEARTAGASLISCASETVYPERPGI